MEKRQLHTRRLAIPDVVAVTPQRLEDERGYFYECWNQRRLASEGFHWSFAQENVAVSRRAGTIRGLHFQAPPHEQGKLVRCSRGRIFDVAVDCRRGSPWFGRWVGEELAPASGRLLFIPAGFLHGYATLEDDSEVVYQCTGPYAAAAETAVRHDDPDLAIDWPIGGRAPILSPRDARAGSFRDLVSPFNYDQPGAEHRAADE